MRCIERTDASKGRLQANKPSAFHCSYRTVATRSQTIRIDSKEWLPIVDREQCLPLFDGAPVRAMGQLFYCSDQRRV